MRHKAQHRGRVINLDYSLIGRLANAAYIAGIRLHGQCVTASMQTAGQWRVEDAKHGALFLAWWDGSLIVTDRYVWKDGSRQYVSQQKRSVSSNGKQPVKKTGRQGRYSMAMPKKNPVITGSDGQELVVTWEKDEKGEDGDETQASIAAGLAGKSDMHAYCQQIGVPVKVVNVKSTVKNGGVEQTMSRKFHSPDFEALLKTLSFSDAMARVATWYEGVYGKTPAEVQADILADITRTSSTDTSNAIRQVIAITPAERNRREAVKAINDAAKSSIETEDDVAAFKAFLAERALAKAKGATAEVGTSSTASETRPGQRDRVQAKPASK